MTKKSKSEEARRLFKTGANCAQSVLGAYAAECGLNHEQAMRLGSSFGGGMGRLREVCGAVSGMFMVVGLKQGYSDLQSKPDKDRHYALIQKLAMEFKSRTQSHSIICRELLGISKDPDSPVSEARTPEYYRKRPCAELVGLAADIVEKYFHHLDPAPSASELPTNKENENPKC